MRPGAAPRRCEDVRVLSRSAFFRRILACPPARELLLNSLAVGEADSAVDLDRVAEHVTDPLLARRIYRHFAEEQKHARLFRRHLEERGFRCTPLPSELDYERFAQRYRMGTPKSRLDDPRPFDDGDLILFFAGSKAGEERACAELEALIVDLGADPETVALLRCIHEDEVRHVSYATEELQRLAAAGHARRVRAELRAARRAEARAHRAVSRAFMGRLMALLGVPRAIRALAGLAIDAAFARRWLFPGGLDAPRLANAMPVPSGPVERA
jgi:rubrerythrin